MARAGPKQAKSRLRTKRKAHRGLLVAFGWNFPGPSNHSYQATFVWPRVIVLLGQPFGDSSAVSGGTFYVVPDPPEGFPMVPRYMNPNFDKVMP